MDVPDFEAILALEWGLNFDAQQGAPSLSFWGMDPSQLERVSGEALPDAPLAINPRCSSGGSGRFGGSWESELA